MATVRLEPRRARIAVLACAVPFFLAGEGSPGPSEGQAKSQVPAWGTYRTPFAARSLWNSRPVNPVLGSYVLPKTAYQPLVGEGPYSTGVFLASASDPAVTIAGVWCPDDEATRSVTIPRWPDDVTPAAGTDGHADIVDIEAGVIHSFWQLRRDGKTWKAASYTWSALSGSGWGEPGHYMRGARASGVATSAGLVRTHEVNDGDEIFRHALAMSLPDAALKEGYVFPATSEDTDAPTSYRGEIPMGSLLMLPADFEVRRLTDPRLKKIARTLKTYGARVVDRNFETRFMIYAENGSGFDLHRNAWDGDAGRDLDVIAGALRVVEHHAGFIGGDGLRFEPDRNLNRASMRGPWTLLEGDRAGEFDSWKQALVFPKAQQPIMQTQRAQTWAREIPWAAWEDGQAYRLSVEATGGATLKLIVRDAAGEASHDTGFIGNGGTTTFVMPSRAHHAELVARSSAGQEGSVRASLVVAE